MFLKRHSIALTLASAVAILLFAVVPADAARGGYSGGRGGHSGGQGGYSGGRGGWDGGRSGYYGGRGGFYPGIGIGIGSYGGYGYGGYGYGRYGYGGSPYYGGYSNYYTQPYYNTPSTTTITIQPGDSNVTTSGYAEPAAPDNRSRVEVRVPNDSVQVFIDGDQTQQTGTDRVYMSPPLDPGKTYHYDIEAKWMDNGKMVDQIRTVTVMPNQTAVVDFNNK